MLLQLSMPCADAFLMPLLRLLGRVVRGCACSLARSKITILMFSFPEQ